MARRLSQPFRCRAIGELARQLLFAPPDKRIEQVRRAEKLHDQIDPGVAYPFEFISYRVTGYRSEANEASLLVGAAILPDLRLLIDTLGRSVDMPAEASDPVETPEALAARLGISTRTIGRWRRLGLRWRWAPGVAGGPRRLVLTRSAVERFLADHKPRAERAVSFSRIPPEQRRQIINRARRLAAARGATFNRVAAHLARRTGRALETIRLILQKHNAANPHDALFPDRIGPLTARQKRVILRAHRMGVAAAKIARHFRRTRTTIHRVIRDHRAAAIARLDIAFVPSPMYVRPDADEVILRADSDAVSEPLPDAGRESPAHEQPVFVGDLPEPLRPIFAAPGLDAERTRSLLVRYHYLMFKAHQAREQFKRRPPRMADLDRIETDLAQAAALRRRLIAAGQRVALSVARKHLVGQADASVNRLVELVEVGQEVLREAIEKYDATRDHTFEAFLTWSLMRRFASHQARPTKAHRRIDADALAREIGRIDDG